LCRGASLGEIGEPLGHRHPQTTKIYTKVDIKVLRTLARRWPGSSAVAGRCAMKTLRKSVQDSTGALGATAEFRPRFARHHGAADQRTEIPPYGLLPFRAKRARPYLYSDGEIRSLLRATLDMPCRYEFGKLRPWTYHCLFGLLSVSGLRLGEARNLELQDVDLKMALSTIRDIKFGKSRLVPLHASTCTVLADYNARRERHWEGRLVSSYLFVSSQGNRLDGGDIHRTSYALSRQIGLHGISDHHGHTSA